MANKKTSKKMKLEKISKDKKKNLHQIKVKNHDA